MASVFDGWIDYERLSGDLRRERDGMRDMLCAVLTVHGETSVTPEMLLKAKDQMLMSFGPDYYNTITVKVKT